MREIEPIFDFSTDASNILIHQSKAEISINQNTYMGNGEVRLELLPRANIYFYGYFPNVPTEDAKSAIFEQPPVSSFSINGCKIEGSQISSEFNEDSQEFSLKWCPSNEPFFAIGNESTEMSLLVFHLFNFVDFVGTRRSIQQIGTAKYGIGIEHVDLICDKWNVELKSLFSTKDEIKKLKKEGGYRLTHVGGIKRTDHSLFSGKDAQECLKAFGYFLSFAKGGWCKPICAVGFDESDNRVWELWSSPKEPWHVSWSWFDPHAGAQLATLYPKFMKKWGNVDWRETLKEVIYWYLNANFSSRGIDAGIILTQAAIERLSYEYCVKDKRLLHSDEFKNLKASDKFRRLFSSLCLPLEIPKETPDLAKFAKNSNWLDAPHALTDIRNSLVHPQHNKRRELTAVYYEAWNLGLWYLAMALLAVCEYSGTYGNRLKKERYVGEVEKVPWV